MTKEIRLFKPVKREKFPLCIQTYIPESVKEVQIDMMTEKKTVITPPGECMYCGEVIGNNKQYHEVN